MGWRDRAQPQGFGRGRSAQTGSGACRSKTEPLRTDDGLSRACVWLSQGEARPVVVTGYLGQMAGQEFMQVEGSLAGVSLDELEPLPPEQVETEDSNSASVPIVKCDYCNSPNLPIGAERCPVCGALYTPAYWRVNYQEEGACPAN